MLNATAKSSCELSKTKKNKNEKKMNSIPVVEDGAK